VQVGVVKGDGLPLLWQQVLVHQHMEVATGRVQALRWMGERMCVCRGGGEEETRWHQ
jgi:hypothetical protein